VQLKIIPKIFYRFLILSIALLSFMPFFVATAPQSQPQQPQQPQPQSKLQIRPQRKESRSGLQPTPQARFSMSNNQLNW